MPDLPSLVALITQGGPVVILIMVIYAMLSGRLITARHHEEVCAGLQRERDVACADADEWRELARRGMDLSEAVTGQERQRRAR